MKKIAFIPARGGSKSIPLKNIKMLCGKPLICWSIEALENSNMFDEIIVATDSYKIKETVASFNYPHVTIYNRLPENACDSASTESVMLEYINKTLTLQDNDVFALVQATSPLTEDIHFREAMLMYSQGKYDSILSCVKTYRFLWNKDGKPLNYDFRHRPRRQDYEGSYVENGAFYLNTVGQIKKCKNRLYGKIGIYEMPQETLIEIDEPSDFIEVEKILRKRVHPSYTQIKLFLTDIDGTLTDGGMYYGDNGVELKKFNTKDAVGMKELQKGGVKVGMVTSENTRININRANKIGVDYLIQGVHGQSKLDSVIKYADKNKISLSEIAYIGDDINCIKLLSSVGICACPQDAVDEVKAIPCMNVMSKKGGEGCVREFIDTIIKGVE